MIQAHQGYWSAETGWVQPLPDTADPSLLLVFGSVGRSDSLTAELHRRWPGALLLGCSTAGQIYGTRLQQTGAVVTSLHFAQTRLQLVEAPLNGPEASFATGKQLAQQLHQPDLVHVLVLAEGIEINGSALVAGLAAGLPANTGISGGLAGDNTHFRETLIYTPTGCFSQHVAALGLYSQHLKVGCGSCGGWDPFGPERLITRSEANEVFEMDGQPALELYARYLGTYAEGLPATGLLFPLEVRLPQQASSQTVVRTILGVNKDRGSLIFAGDVPTGAYARLMKTNVEHLLDGAAEAARHSQQYLDTTPQAALLVSCVGRKMVLKQRSEEELEEVGQVLGKATLLSGFYSYGEIAPGLNSKASELHNQTMTVTVLAEVEAQ